MFNYCEKLKSIKGINKFNTSEVTTMKAMFQFCNELEELNLSNFDTSKVKDIESMFPDNNKIKLIFKEDNLQFQYNEYNNDNVNDRNILKENFVEKNDKDEASL